MMKRSNSQAPLGSNSSFWLPSGTFAHGITLAPVNDIPGVLADPQLEARGFWAGLEVDGVEVRAPGGFKGRAPRLGEHTDEVLLPQPRG